MRTLLHTGAFAVALTATVGSGVPSCSAGDQHDFVKASLASTSGKSGRPERTFEVLSTGEYTLRREDGSVVRRGKLDPKIGARFGEVLQGSALAAEEISDCGEVRMTDTPSRVVTVAKRYKTVTFVLASACEAPPRLTQLIDLFDQALAALPPLSAASP